MIDKLSGMYNRINDTISIKQQLFNLPDLNLRPGTKPPELKPGDDYTASSQVRSFNTVEEALAAELPIGTEIIVGGRKATVE
jgi:hypothetical protein